jgi:hypothetical protein
MEPAAPFTLQKALIAPVICTFFFGCSVYLAHVFMSPKRNDIFCSIRSSDGEKVTGGSMDLLDITFLRGGAAFWLGA